MIVRNARRESIDYGPTPGIGHTGISGSICRPVSTPRRSTPEQQAYINEWKRRKRREDAAWAERERAYDRERQQGRNRSVRAA